MTRQKSTFSKATTGLLTGLSGGVFSTQEKAEKFAVEAEAGERLKPDYPGPNITEYGFNKTFNNG